MVGGKPQFDRFFVVIGPAIEFFTAADIANTVFGRQLVEIVVAGAATGAGESSGDPFGQRLVVNHHLDHTIELESFVHQHLIQRLCLCQGPREAVQDKTGRAIRLTDPIGDDADDNVIGNQITRFHNAICSLADV